MHNIKSLSESDQNLWSIVKMESYEGGKQYKRKADLRKAVKTTMSEIEPAEIK